MTAKRIPTLIGIVLIAVGALVGVMVVRNGTSFLPRAAPEYIPQRIKVTNISDSGFTISWVTQEPTIGFIKLGTSVSDLETTVVDERDQLTGDSGQYRTHYISVLGLEPSTTYYLKLGSHDKRLYDNEGEALMVSTGPALGELPPADTAYGQVVTSAQTPAEGTMVYITLSDAVNTTPLSALVKQNGNWAVSLSSARTQDLSGYAVYDPQTTTLDILARASLTEEATVKTTTANDQPVPEITLGQVHDFTDPPPAEQDAQPAPTGLNTPPSVESKFSLLPLSVTEPEEETAIAITNPATNTTVVNQTQPQIIGTAPPGANLTITIHSEQIYTDTVYADETGSWSWVPPGTLTPGEHTVTISYSDEQGILHTVSRSFVVASAEASSDGSPVYTASPSAIVSPTTPPQPTALPTMSISPTSSPTAPPPTSPTTPPIITPPPTTLPPAGSLTPTLTLVLAGLFLISFGTIALRKSYK